MHTDMIHFGGTVMPRTRYQRISDAHGALLDAVARSGHGPREAGAVASARIWREHGDRSWSSADLEAEADAVRAAVEAHPDYAEWMRLSCEMDERIARNRALGRPLLAFTDADWDPC